MRIEHKALSKQIFLSKAIFFVQKKESSNLPIYNHLKMTHHQLWCPKGGTKSENYILANTDSGAKVLEHVPSNKAGFLSGRKAVMYPVQCSPKVYLSCTNPGVSCLSLHVRGEEREKKRQPHSSVEHGKVQVLKASQIPSLKKPQSCPCTLGWQRWQRIAAILLPWLNVSERARLRTAVHSHVLASVLDSCRSGKTYQQPN